MIMFVIQAGCIIRTCAGEYVAVEKLESIFKNSPLIEQLWVYGNSYEAYLVAVVVPSEKALLEWAKTHGKQGTYKVCCALEPDTVLV